MEKVENDLEEDISMVSRMIYGNWMQQVTFVFAELGIADSLKSSPKSIAELAEELGLVESYFTRFMRCASELGYATLDYSTNKYTLSQRGALLGSYHPESKRAEARLNGEDYRYLPWMNLIQIVKHGMDEEYSPTIKDGTLDYLADKPKLLKTFHSAMTVKSKVENYDIIEDFDFSGYTKLMDIGCGEGTFLKSILDNNDHLHGIMYDLPETFKDEIEEKYKGKLSKATGSFFESIPDTADAYILKNVIHNWREFKAKNIMNTVREAMISTDGIDTDLKDKRFLIVENIVPDDGSKHIANWMDLNFMVLVDGAERTVEQYRQLGAECGFKLEATHDTNTGRHIIEYSLA